MRRAVAGRAGRRPAVLVLPASRMRALVGSRLAARRSVNSPPMSNPLFDPLPPSRRLRNCGNRRQLRPDGLQRAARCRQPVASGDGAHAQRGHRLRRRRSRPCRARRRHGRLQRRRGRQRHCGQRHQQRHARRSCKFGTRAFQGRHQQRPHSRGAAAAAADRAGQQGHLRSRAGAPECAGMGTTLVATVFFSEPGQHRPHRRLTLLSAACRHVSSS